MERRSAARRSACSVSSSKVKVARCLTILCSY
jgi:hypothetical protein